MIGASSSRIITALTYLTGITCLLFTLSGVAQTGKATESDTERSSGLTTSQNSNGSFISYGNSTLYLEGLTKEQLSQSAQQIFWGGIIPGILLGSRPFVSGVLDTVDNDSAVVASTVYGAQTFAGYGLAMMGALANIKNIIDAGMGYTTLSSFFSTLHAGHILNLLGNTYEGYSRSMHEYRRATFTAIALLSYYLSPDSFKGASPRPVYLQDNVSHRLFIQLGLPPQDNNAPYIEFSRTGFNSKSRESRQSPLNRLADTMDQIGLQNLTVFPSTEVTGNQLLLAVNKSTDSPPTLIEMDLNFGRNRYTPWLEESYLNAAELDSEAYFSVFHESLLHQISDALLCTQGACATGVLSDSHDVHKVYRPFRNQITDVHLNTDENSSTPVASLGGQFTLSLDKKALTITSPDATDDLHYQYRLPRWLVSLFNAEITYSARELSLHSLRAALHEGARSLDLNLEAPTRRVRRPEIKHHIYYGYYDEPVARTPSGDYYEMTIPAPSAAHGPSHGPSYNPTPTPLVTETRPAAPMMSSVAPSESSHSSSSLQLSSFSWSDHLFSRPSHAANATHDAYTTGVGDPSATRPAPQPNKRLRPVLDFGQKRNSPKDPLYRFNNAPADPRDSIEGGFGVDNLRKPYAAGIVEDLQVAASRDSDGEPNACIICLEEGSPAEPLYKCPQCRAGMGHLGCLDEYAFNEIQNKHTGYKYSLHWHDLFHLNHEVNVPCSSCKHPLAAQIRWSQIHKHY
ncbi:hypothetical protein [Parendozoicomonas haliclonae]|uniref:Uncharacterized protein n=1 Tax=Parendozoicomonas haliclonae TaxID=1960125 RepID=A0A1X7AQQ0_9GAMM|nr:hypothetical protein [Parendozoicomonas haliclonae]SMA50483.1 hypothetical protein EHSB41UT_04294 [Parendozoicomonas haliclonae]